jgi:hypothetical protein
MVDHIHATMMAMIHNLNQYFASLHPISNHLLAPLHKLSMPCHSDQRAAICEEEPTNGWIWDGETQNIGSNCESLPSSSHGCGRPWTQANCAYTCGSCFGTASKTSYNVLKNTFPDWANAKAYWVAHRNMAEKQCLDVDHDSCLQFAIEKCTLDAKCSYFTVATKQSVRNAYGYNLYEEDAGSYLQQNDDWDTFQKIEHPNTMDNWCDDDIRENYLGSGNAERRTCPNRGTCTIDDITFECVGSEWILVEKIPYFHLNITFNEGFNGAEAYESHRDAIQAVMSNYLECNKEAINATFITHIDMSAEVKFVITGMSERQVARTIDDSWHFLKLPLKFIFNGVPVVRVDTVHTSWERNIYDSSSALLTVFMASFVLCIFF